MHYSVVQSVLWLHEIRYSACICLFILYCTHNAHLCRAFQKRRIQEKISSAVDETQLNKLAISSFLLYNMFSTNV